MFDIKVLEKRLDRRLKKNHTSLGIDVGSRTGVCIAVTTDKTVSFSFSYLNMKDMKPLEKYNSYIDFFKDKVTKVNTVVIEDAFFGRNAMVFAMLARFGIIIYTLAQLLSKAEKYFYTAVAARKMLGLNAIKKKEEVQEEFKDLTKIKLDDPDIVDALILSIVGLLKE